MWNCPDHPEIVSAMKTGYSKWSQPETIYCQECGCEINGHIYEDENHEYLCEGCLLYFHRKEEW